MKISYIIQLKENDAKWRFEVDTSRAQQQIPTGLAPEWTRLDFCMCKSCKLDSSTHEYCPVALDLKDVITQFGAFRSYDKVKVRVETPQRAYEKDLDMQSTIQSLMGLIMASSACPVLSNFKGFVQFHIPFLTVEENLFRVVGFYLIKQYFKHKNGEPIDFELKQLSALYSEAFEVNNRFSDRIASANTKEANMGAMGRLSLGSPRRARQDVCRLCSSIGKNDSHEPLPASC